MIARIFGEIFAAYLIVCMINCMCFAVEKIQSFGQFDLPVNQADRVESTNL